MPDRIPFAYISEVVFVSNASLNYGQYLCKSFAHPAFSVKAQTFTDSPRALQTAINFTYVKEFLLADPKVGPNMVYSEKNRYSKTRDNFVKVVAGVSALSGIQGKVLLRGMTSSVEKVVEVREFPRHDEYRYICDIALNELSVGRYLVKYFLGDICWSIRGFEVVP